MIDNTLNPDFVRKFILDYFFEERQNLRFDLYVTCTSACVCFCITVTWLVPKLAFKTLDIDDVIVHWISVWLSWKLWEVLKWKILSGKCGCFYHSHKDDCYFHLYGSEASPCLSKESRRSEQQQHLLWKVGGCCTRSLLVIALVPSRLPRLPIVCSLYILYLMHGFRLSCLIYY